MDRYFIVSYHYGNLQQFHKHDKYIKLLRDDRNINVWNFYDSFIILEDCGKGLFLLKNIHDDYIGLNKPKPTENNFHCLTFGSKDNALKFKFKTSKNYLVPLIDDQEYYLFSNRKTDYKLSVIDNDQESNIQLQKRFFVGFQREFIPISYKSVISLDNNFHPRYNFPTSIYFVNSKLFRFKYNESQQMQIDDNESNFEWSSNFKSTFKFDQKNSTLNDYYFIMKSNNSSVMPSKKPANRLQFQLQMINPMILTISDSNGTNPLRYLSEFHNTLKPQLLKTQFGQILRLGTFKSFGRFRVSTSKLVDNFFDPGTNNYLAGKVSINSKTGKKIFKYANFKNKSLKFSKNINHNSFRLVVDNSEFIRVTTNEYFGYQFLTFNERSGNVYCEYKPQLLSPSLFITKEGKVENLRNKYLTYKNGKICFRSSIESNNSDSLSQIVTNTPFFDDSINHPNKLFISFPYHPGLSLYVSVSENDYTDHLTISFNNIQNEPKKAIIRFPLSDGKGGISNMLRKKSLYINKSGKFSFTDKFIENDEKVWPIKNINFDSGNIQLDGFNYDVCMKCKEGFGDFINVLYDKNSSKYLSPNIDTHSFNKKDVPDYTDCCELVPLNYNFPLRFITHETIVANCTIPRSFLKNLVWTSEGRILTKDSKHYYTKSQKNSIKNLNNGDDNYNFNFINISKRNPPSKFENSYISFPTEEFTINGRNHKYVSINFNQPSSNNEKPVFVFSILSKNSNKVLDIDDKNLTFRWIDKKELYGYFTNVKGTNSPNFIYTTSKRIVYTLITKNNHRFDYYISNDNDELVVKKDSNCKLLSNDQFNINNPTNNVLEICNLRNNKYLYEDLKFYSDKKNLNSEQYLDVYLWPKENIHWYWK